jgi:hypothetical protein
MFHLTHEEYLAEPPEVVKWMLQMGAVDSNVQEKLMDQEIRKAERKHSR